MVVAHNVCENMGVAEVLITALAHIVLKISY